MNIDFNNVRRLAIFAYEGLTEKLNDSINKTGEISIHPGVIQKEMDDLKSYIGAIAMIYDPNDEKIKDVYSEVFPGDSQKMTRYNDQL